MLPILNTLRISCRLAKTRTALHAIDLAVFFVSAWVIASLLGIDFLLSHNLPTGGDTASHLLYAWTYSKEILPQGRITAWMPEVFAGTPFLSYYFPLPFISIAALAAVLPFAPAMKIGMFAAAMALPGAVWLGSVYLLQLRRVVAIWGVLATLAFLLHEQHSIWGGNLLSTLAGEFAYSYGMLFSILTLFAWQRTVTTGRGWWLAALLEAATGFSHGFALLITGFATTAFLFDRRDFLRNLRLLILGHSLAFFLLAGWLWPMLQMHGITIPNDALFELTQWQDLLPKPVQPVLLAGLLAGFLHFLIQIFPPLRRRLPSNPEIDRTLRHAGWMASAALLGAAGFMAGSSIGLANIRFFPFVWLFGGLACAWLWGSLLLRLANGLGPISMAGLITTAVGCALGLVVWTSMTVTAVFDWGLWNHSGLEAKPQWQQLSRLFPALSGKLDSPRLLFEHDPANNDIGSTRALEALPMFLGGRPVLEGLFMESTVVGPAIYQLQSEVSRHPSSPLARFPSGSFDLDMAAQHMDFLYSNEVIIRNNESRDAFDKSSLFTPIASAPPFTAYKLNAFKSQIVDLVDRPLQWLPQKGWMEASFEWFRSRQKFASVLPVFYDGDAPTVVRPIGTAQIQDIDMQRHSLSWRTEALGAAHLVRMAWHPRWHLVSKGQLYLAGPGFMLVVPEEADVRLEYGDTPIGIAGMVATILSLLTLGALIWRSWLNRGKAGQQATNSRPWPQNWPAVIWPLILIGLGAWLHLSNPERIYTGAWELMRSNLHAEAAKKFDLSFEARKSNSKKEEAIFWAAKAYEQAGLPDTARQRYHELTENYHGYWLAESLYTEAKLEQLAGDLPRAEALRARLRLQFPNDRWTRQLLTDAKK